MATNIEAGLLAANVTVALRKMGWAVEREDRTDLIVESKTGPCVNAMELRNDLLFLQITEKIHDFVLVVETIPFNALVRVS